MEILSMGNLSHTQGQALVETALLIPLLLGLAVCLFQLLLVVHLHMKLHRTAVHMTEQLALGSAPAVVEANALIEYRSSLRWGIPIATAQVENLELWRPYEGMSTATSRNCVAIGTLSYALTTHWLASLRWAPVLLKAQAELPCEPFRKGTVS
jgi:hypothetical protein